MTFPQPKGSLNSLSLLANMYADLLHSLETVLMIITKPRETVSTHRGTDGAFQMGEGPANALEPFGFGVVG